MTDLYLKPIRRALISVTDKKDLVHLAKKLLSHGVDLVASGKTFSHLVESHISATEIKDITNYPEILGGRVKTLHPQVHGGILYRRGNARDEEEIIQHHIPPIDLVIVNLYPFEQVQNLKDIDERHIIENIDIGGVALIRAAAKNFQDVVILNAPEQYEGLIEELEKHKGKTSLPFRKKVAGEAFARTYAYDHAIASWFAPNSEPQKQDLSLNYSKAYDLRYGENPHQKAAFYLPVNAKTSLTDHVIQGKTLSYNNLLDLHHVIRILQDFRDQKACVIVKHNNPCGVATAASSSLAFLLAKECDPVSSFGGIVGFSSECDLAAAKACNDMFLEAILAPSVTEEARQILAKKKNVRLIELSQLFDTKLPEKSLRSVLEGILVQDTDTTSVNIRKCKVVTQKQPTEEEWKALELSWTIVKHVKSNAIVLSDSTKTLGIGAGQMSRIDSVKLAHQKTNLTPTGPIALASDAFFPFRDGVDLAAKIGVQTIVQPGGSIRDQEVIDAANEHGISMIFTNTRHFSH